LKLKTKIYLFQLIFAVVLLGFELFTYENYKTQYNKDIQEYIDDRTNFYKDQLISSYYEASYKFNMQKPFFVSIHQKVLDILKDNNNTKLEDITKEIKKEFQLKDVNFNIYLIDKNYVIYKTTYPKDLKFDLSVIPDAKEYLDKTKIDKKIYISDFVSTDSLTMEYRLYSYSYLDENSFLELGFIDNRIYNSLKTIFEKLIKNSNIEIYNIVTVDNKLYYYPFSPDRQTSKEEFYKKVKKYALDKQKSNNPFLQIIKQKQAITIYKDNYAIAYIPFFKKDMFSEIGFENVILKVKIDISSKLKALEKYETIFYISIATTILFLFILYFFINRYFTYPIEVIVKAISNKQKVEDKTLLETNDELSIITKEYNILFDSLNKEILTNKTLLEENKRFIADTVHQIRTPLTNIMMNSEMIKRSNKENKVQNFIDQINASINMLTNSYEDLSYTITYDTLEYPATKLSLSDILTQRVKFFSTIAKVNFKELLPDIEKDIYFEINQIELERLIDNNISNAIKYADTNRPITIILKRSQSSIILEFKSYSKPIKNPKKLFEKNYRENESKRGLGLGLNMVKLICQKYKIEYTLSYSDGQNIFKYKFITHYPTYASS